MLHKVLEEEKKVLLDKMFLLAEWNNTAMLLEKWLGFIKPELKPAISVGVQNGQIHGVLLHIYCADIEEVTPVLRLLSNLDFHLQKEPEDFPEIQRRTWLLKRGETPVKLNAFFSDTQKTKCKFVKTGTKVVDVFELKCEDELAEANKEAIEQPKKDEGEDIPF